MRVTAASPLFAAALRRKMSEERFAGMIRARERQLEEHFARRG
jgi:hypothetical protein